MNSWFPRPKTAQAIFSAGVSQEKMPPAAQIFEMMNAADAVEWRNRVGVTELENGATKTTTRLLCSGNLVFKTHTDLVSANSDSLIEKLYEWDTREQLYKLWHPQKFRFVYFANDKYWLCSATPLMKTVSEVHHWEARSRWWVEMLRIALRSLQIHDVMPDLNPANFGFTAERDVLCYLDDDLIPDAGIGSMAVAIVRRIAAEPPVVPAQWHQFGRDLNRNLRPYFHKDDEWELLVTGVAQQLVGAENREKHEALIRGMENLAFQPQKSAAKRGRSAKICVFGDVHANLPALDAVLKAASALGATHYLFLGDAVGYGPHPRECVQRLGNLPNLLAVQGNHDYWVGTGDWQRADESSRMLAAWSREMLQANETSWLLKLPPELAYKNWLARHGAPTNPDFLFGFVNETNSSENLAAIAGRGFAMGFFGHTHLPMVCRLRGGEALVLKSDDVEIFRDGDTLLINPGAVGQPRDGDPRAAFAIWDRATELLHFQRVEYPVNQTIADLRKLNLPEIISHPLIARLEQG